MDRKERAADVYGVEDFEADDFAQCLQTYFFTDVDPGCQCVETLSDLPIRGIAEGEARAGRPGVIRFAPRRLVTPTTQRVLPSFTSCAQ